MNVFYSTVFQFRIRQAEDTLRKIVGYCCLMSPCKIQCAPRPTTWTLNSAIIRQQRPRFLSGSGTSHLLQRHPCISRSDISSPQQRHSSQASISPVRLLSRARICQPSSMQYVRKAPEALPNARKSWRYTTGHSPGVSSVSYQTISRPPLPPSPSPRPAVSPPRY